MIDSLYAIIDLDAADHPLELTFRALNAGCAFVQLRAKHADDASFLAIAKRMRSACTHAAIPLVINDRADIARLVHADGLHLGQDDLSIREARRVVGEMKIGRSTHDLDQAVRADADGADLIAFGPIFETRSKENPDPVVGLKNLETVAQSASCPVVAIGGITPENASEALRAGARYVAAISALPIFLGGAS